jgi:hypothetical protein
MKRCQNCGTQNEDGMNFCVQCGIPLSKTQNSTGEPTASFKLNQTDEPIEKPEVETLQRNFSSLQIPQKKGRKKLFWILSGVGALILLLFIGVIGILSFNYAMTKKNAPKPTPVRTSNNSPVPTASSSPTVLASPEVSFTPPTVPTKEGSFTVSAYLGWQISDIDVVPNERFSTSVQGKIDLDGLKKGVSSNGINDENAKSRRLYPQYPTGALLMRTRYADGKFSNIQAVTAPPSIGQWQNAPDERGKIEFCVNDNKAGLNLGNLTVTVKLFSVPDKKK